MIPQYPQAIDMAGLARLAKAFVVLLHNEKLMQYHQVMGVSFSPVPSCCSSIWVSHPSSYHGLDQ